MRLPRVLRTLRVPMAVRVPRVLAVLRVLGGHAQKRLGCLGAMFVEQQGVPRKYVTVLGTECF